MPRALPRLPERTLPPRFSILLGLTDDDYFTGQYLSATKTKLSKPFCRSPQGGQSPPPGRTHTSHRCWNSSSALERSTGSGLLLVSRTGEGRNSRAMNFGADGRITMFPEPVEQRLGQRRTGELLFIAQERTHRAQGASCGSSDIQETEQGRSGSTKMGQTNIRKLLIIGAMSRLRWIIAAAHIRPVEANGPDIVSSNGLALSGTAHWMFDRGLISLNDDLKILISRQANDVDGISGDRKPNRSCPTTISYRRLTASAFPSLAPRALFQALTCRVGTASRLD